MVRFYDLMLVLFPDRQSVFLFRLLCFAIVDRSYGCVVWSFVRLVGIQGLGDVI